jgi:uncharacterized membrane protein
MDTHNWLRLIHIVVGVFWVGTALFVATILVPAIRAVGPTGGAVMREVMEKRKLPVVLTTASFITIISGSILAWRDAGALGFRWFESGAGLGFGIGAVAAIIGTIIGLGVNMPTGKKISAIMSRVLAESRPPSEQEATQLRMLQGRMTTASRFTAVLLLLATALMATARNFGAS